MEELAPEPQPIAESEPVKILITRHSFSCNQKTSKKALDPALTRNGIIMAMDRAKYEVMGKRLYDSDRVLVSCLLRTWQTALLLYNPDISDIEETDSDSDSDFLLLEIKNRSPRTIFTLHVYPYLKEHVRFINRGNYPTELKLTLANFLKFLEFIKENYNGYYINSLPERININIWNDEGPPLTFSLTRNGINENPFVVKINEEHCRGCFRQSDSEIINPFVDGSKFVEDGDLNDFVSHIRELSLENKKKLGPNGTIHVVAHSSLMRTYLRGMSIGTGAAVLQRVPALSINDEKGNRTSFTQSDDIDDMLINNISQTNMFSFEMECSGDIATLYKVYLGLSVPPPPTEKNRELCDAGQPSFLDPKLSRVPTHDTYRLLDKVKIQRTNTGVDGSEGIIIGYYIDGNLNDGDGGDMLGLTPEEFNHLEKRKTDVIRVEYSSIVSGEEIIHRKLFTKDNIDILSRRNSVTLTLAGGGRLKKSKRKNKKTTKRKKNKKKSKRRKYKRRKNTKRK